MSQINKYADKAAYESDTARLKTLSSESYIENDGELVYDGVNTVVRKSAAGVGDLVVFDKTDGVLKFIKGATLIADKMPAELVPAGVVYGRQGDKVRIVSLNNATYNGSAGVVWAAPYRVALSDFDLTAGGEFALSFGTGDSAIEIPVSYAAGSTLESIASALATALKAGTKDLTNVVNGGWAATVWGSDIIMTSNSLISDYTNIDVVRGCSIRRTSDDIHYQITLTGLLVPGEIRRTGGANSNIAGYNADKFLQYYSANGSTSTNVLPGSSTIIRESVFTEADNPALVAAYPTYRDYLFGEHMLQYPTAYGVTLQSGKNNTNLIGTLRFTDIFGDDSPCYPAAAAALNYGVTVEGMTAGLEAGAWWLPSVEEMYLLIRDRALTEANADSDPVNRTLSRIGGDMCLGDDNYLHTSCEFSQSYVYSYYRNFGAVYSIDKFAQFTVRPVSEI